MYITLGHPMIVLKNNDGKHSFYGNLKIKKFKQLYTFVRPKKEVGVLKKPY